MNSNLYSSFTSELEKIGKLGALKLPTHAKPVWSKARQAPKAAREIYRTHGPKTLKWGPKSSTSTSAKKPNMQPQFAAVPG